MPNWCDNEIILSHPDKEMVRKAAEAHNENKLLNFFFPVEDPDTVNRQWLFDNWGSRSDISACDKIDVDEAFKTGNFRIRFQTAWTPPIGAMRKAEEAGYKIKLFYLEDSLAFAGVFEDAEDDYYELSDYTSKDVEESLPEELVECFDLVFLLSNQEEENDEEEEDDDD